MCWCLDFGLARFQNCEKSISVVCKPPSLWDFVIATLIDEYTVVVILNSTRCITGRVITGRYLVDNSSF